MKIIFIKIKYIKGELEMTDEMESSNLPVIYRPSEIRAYDVETTDQNVTDEPPIQIIIEARQMRSHIIEYLGDVMARCWVDKGLLKQINKNAHRALRSIGIILPQEIEIKVEYPEHHRPRLIIFEFNGLHTLAKRICYLQMVILAGN
jgi:hypothetical protein